ncbi:TIGR00730 family Rossman fold protein [Peribacillus saganii]|uniref:Cytokinin riboside 5'-monophosphate phosphoribohydrolase n=1 Tax=Peribacillus saganii TaxID=2303992 RepID=A0A372LTD7_9BACI|nr:TIGR00730 family Rossman fold protein [Peribacillus saganii]RFU71062.1 TIGR00730 family Rossman fold protein [Peribacillus saganii]
MQRIAVFCGSSSGASSIFREGAIELGKEMVKRGITLVYGGSSVGLMGQIADTVLDEGGEVIGVIPQMLEDREISHPNLTELFVVGSMHERKAKMADLADGFIALPGGPGTMEEFFEIFTWAQLGLHHKPFGLLNVNSYYDKLVAFFDHMTDQQFMHEKYRSMVFIESKPDQLIEQFKAFNPPDVKKWINEEQT